MLVDVIFIMTAVLFAPFSVKWQIRFVLKLSEADSFFGHISTVY